MLIKSPIPYGPSITEDLQADITIRIEVGLFAGVQYQEGRFTYSFENCRYRKVIVENPDAIAIDDITLTFIGCIIDEIECNHVVSENINIVFLSCFLSGVIQANKLQSIEFNNTIIRNSLFLLHQRKVSISYTEENIFLLRWFKLLKKLNSKPADLLGQKQTFYVHDPVVLYFYFHYRENGKPGRYVHFPPSKKIDEKYGYTLTKKEKELLQFNLNIRFNSLVEKQKIKIHNCSLSSLSLSGNSDAVIEVENVKVSDIYMYDFTPKGTTSFYSISPRPSNEETKIGIHKCQLDGVWFDNVQFDKYDRISFYRSKLAKVIFTSCDFPERYENFERFMPIENVHYPDRRAVNHNKDQYEIFLQLKRAVEDAGNIYEAQKFQAISHEALKRVSSITKDDKVILDVNNISNRHGLSIQKPFYLFIVFSVGFYLLYLLSIGKLFSSDEFDATLIGYYFAFIDITHRTDFLVDRESFTGWSLAIDAIAKIVLGFLIYQFVAAFRKYGKK